MRTYTCGVTLPRDVMRAQAQALRLVLHTCILIVDYLHRRSTEHTSGNTRSLMSSRRRVVKPKHLYVVETSFNTDNRPGNDAARRSASVSRATQKPQHCRRARRVVLGAVRPLPELLARIRPNCPASVQQRT